ncbi:hypothetical protein WH266_27565, partial [Pseudomonas sp. MYb330]
MGNLASGRKSHSIKKDLEGIEHRTCCAFLFKIAAFGSSYRRTHFLVGAAEGCDLLMFKKKGSSRITGKDALDLHEKELAIPVT